MKTNTNTYEIDKKEIYLHSNSKFQSFYKCDVIESYVKVLSCLIIISKATEYFEGKKYNKWFVNKKSQPLLTTDIYIKEETGLPLRTIQFALNVLEKLRIITRKTVYLSEVSDDERKDLQIKKRKKGMVRKIIINYNRLDVLEKVDINYSFNNLQLNRIFRKRWFTFVNIDADDIVENKRKVKLFISYQDEMKKKWQRNKKRRKELILDKLKTFEEKEEEKKRTIFIEHGEIRNYINLIETNPEPTEFSKEERKRMINELFELVKR